MKKLLPWDSVQTIAEGKELGYLNMYCAFGMDGAYKKAYRGYERRLSSGQVSVVDSGVHAD